MSVFPEFVMAWDSLFANFLLLIAQPRRLGYKRKKCNFGLELCLKVRGTILWWTACWLGPKLVRGFLQRQVGDRRWSTHAFQSRLSFLLLIYYVGH